MPVVHNTKSQAKGFCGRGRKGRGRRANATCSLFVLIALGGGGAYISGAVEVGFGPLAETLPTVKFPERSLSRESEADAKRMDTALPSQTLSLRQFKRA